MVCSMRVKSSTASSLDRSAPSIRSPRMWAQPIMARHTLLIWLIYPQFTSISTEVANTWRAVYHALQTKIDQRLTHGLNFLFAYTHSKLMTNLNSGASYVNDRRNYRTVSQYDQPNVFRVALTYELPV